MTQSQLIKEAAQKENKAANTAKSIEDAKSGVRKAIEKGYGVSKEYATKGIEKAGEFGEELGNVGLSHVQDNPGKYGLGAGVAAGLGVGYAVKKMKDQYKQQNK